MTEILRNYYSAKELNTVSLLVISNSNFTKLINDALLNVYKTRGSIYKLKVNTAENISDITEFTNHIPVDYVIFVLDTRNAYCVEEIMGNLKYLDSNFILGRVCFVNGTPYVPDVASTLNLITSTSSKFKIPILNGDIQSHDKCLRLAERILILTETSFKKDISFIPWIFH